MSRTPNQPHRATGARLTRGAAYVRVSSDRQAEEAAYGPELQRSAIEAYARENGIAISDWYEDHATGVHLENRPAINRLRSRLHDYDALVCFKLDRIGRGAPQIIVLAECELAEVEVHASHDHVDRSELNDVITSVTAWQSRKEHRDIRDRMIAGRQARVRAGKLSPGPRPLYGYDWADDDRSRYVRNPETGPVVHRIYREAAAGSTLGAICRGLERDSIPTPTGKSNWSRTQVRVILRERKYTGQAVAWRTDGSGGIEMPAGTVEPLVSVGDFDAVWQRIASNQQHVRRTLDNPEDFLLKGGFIRCGYCGRALRPKNRTGRRNTRVPEYLCQGDHGFYGTCEGKPVVVASTVDGWIWGKISQLLHDPDAIITELTRQRHLGSPVQQEIATLDRLIARADRKVESLASGLDLLETDDLRAVVLEKMNAQRTGRQRLLEERQRLNEQHSAWQETQGLFEAIRHVISSTAPETMDIQHRRALLSLLQVEVKLYRADHSPRFMASASLPLDGS